MSSRQEKYEQELNKTARFLSTPKTIKQVAKRFEISVFAAYERIDALKKDGRARFDCIVEGPKGKTGPKAAAYVAA